MHRISLRASLAGVVDDDQRMPRLRRSRTLPSPDAADPAEVPRSVLPGDSLCGYRVVRKLGDSARAEVFLGFSESTLDASQPTTAALKVFRRGASRESIMTELEALSRAAHPHVVRFADVATASDGSPCLVLERLARGSLAHLLEVRPTLAAGEAVTILAPIGAALDALHLSGVVHGAIGAHSVMFRESGAPVIARFGRSCLVPPALSDAALANEARVLADRSALGALAQLVLARTDSSIEIPDPTTDRFGEVLATRLFETAGASPVRFGGDAEPVVSAVPGRLGVVRAAADPPSAGRGGMLERARAIAARLAVQARSVRRPVWVVAASVVVALIAAVALVPGEQPEARAEPQPTGTPVTQAPIVDDPIAALPMLLAAREQCVASASVLCLDAVDQQGSQAFDSDAALIVGIQSGGEIPDAAAIVPGAIDLVEQLGDTVLISLGGKTKPASVLLVKSEAGWRIRDYLD